MKREFSLSPEGENWAGVNELGANFLYKRNVWVFVCLFFFVSFWLALKKQNQLNAIMNVVFKICTSFELHCALPLQQILMEDLEILLYHINGQKIKSNRT